MKKKNHRKISHLQLHVEISINTKYKNGVGVVSFDIKIVVNIVSTKL